MNTTKSFYIVAFFAALINFLIAANLYFVNGIAFGFSVGRFGGVQEGSVSAISAIVIGCALMIASVYFFFVYRKEKKEIKEKWLEEEKELILKASKKRK